MVVWIAKATEQNKDTVTKEHVQLVSSTYFLIQFGLEYKNSCLIFQYFWENNISFKTAIGVTGNTGALVRRHVEEVTVIEFECVMILHNPMAD